MYYFSTITDLVFPEKQKKYVQNLLSFAYLAKCLCFPKTDKNGIKKTSDVVTEIGWYPDECKGYLETVKLTTAADPTCNKPTSQKNNLIST